MSFVHQKLVTDWEENRESCIERFRLIVTAKVDPPIAPSNDGVGGTRLIPPLAPELLQSRIHDVTYAVAIEREDVADHADKYVDWLDNRLPASHIVAVFGLDGTLVKQASNFPSLNGTPSLQPLLEMLVGRYDSGGQSYESVAAVANGIIMHAFEAYYYTWGWYGNDSRIPAAIVIVTKGSPPPIGYVAFLCEFGGHPSTATTPEETAEKLEYLFGINLPRPLPCAPTFEDLAYRTKSTAEEVEETFRDALCDSDFERCEVIVADERIAWQFFTYRPDEGFRWEWFEGAPGSIFPLPPAQESPPSDERIDAAIVAAIRSGTIGENELATIRRTSKSEWPDTLWTSLGFLGPAEDTRTS